MSDGLTRTGTGCFVVCCTHIENSGRQKTKLCLCDALKARARGPQKANSGEPHFSTGSRGPPSLPFDPAAYLEVVERLHLGAHTLQLVIIDLLDLPQRLSHLVLPELAVFGRRVTVRQRRQLLHLLYSDTVIFIPPSLARWRRSKYWSLSVCPSECVCLSLISFYNSSFIYKF